MFAELSKDVLIVGAGGALCGAVLVAIIFALLRAVRSGQQDPRDSRIRSLEAELRVAQSVTADTRTETERLQDELKETAVGLERRDLVISKQQHEIQKISSDLKDSVMKTRQLRSELADRAAQGMHAEAKIREVETELSVAQASNDMMATGVLDYEIAPKRRSTDEYSRAEDKIQNEKEDKAS